jgi:hypothetical protein
MRKVIIAVVFVLVIIAVVFGALAFSGRNQSDSVAATDAAKFVGSDTAASDVVAGDRPEAGTYTYTGTGTESVDFLSGSSRTFPKQISVVVDLDSDNDCNWIANVVFVKQHVEERRYCTKDGLMTDRGFTLEIEFFNIMQKTEYTCPDDAERLRTEAVKGDTWKWTCTSGTTAKTDYVATLLGMETLSIGGEDVETWHTRVASKQSGITVGSATADFWHAKTGLTVKFTNDFNIRTESLAGKTGFKEKTSYTLDSLDPAV